MMTTDDHAPRRAFILLIICIALFAGVLNASALGVMLPDIGADLSVSAAQLGWVMTGFLLVYGIAIPFYGRLADRHGTKTLFILGIAIFPIGSLVCALAPNFETLLLGRIVQASGGAAVPGLGMTLASLAYPPDSRGKALGILAATIGAGSAVGPLLGGALSQTLGWQSIFFFNAATVLLVPAALIILPPDGARPGGRTDFWGGAGLGMMVVGALLAPSAAVQSGWLTLPVLSGAVLFITGLLTLIYRQRKAGSPFIPPEFLRNRQYLSLTGMSFVVMAANLAVLIGLPILIATFHGLTALQVGLVMLPGAVSSSVFGVLAGRLTDRKGSPLPMRAGAPIMLLAVLGLSTWAGASIWPMAAFAGLLGAGFALVNTPLAATVSKIMRGPLLASALSINSMLFFLGGSFGATLLIAVTAARGAPSGSSALNPFHSGVAAAFSDGFMILTTPILAALALSWVISDAREPRIAGPEAAPDVTAATANGAWTTDCSVPWAPHCVEHRESVPSVIRGDEMERASAR